MPHDSAAGRRRQIIIPLAVCPGARYWDRDGKAPRACVELPTGGIIWESPTIDVPIETEKDNSP
jgi:hypothetical protein